MFIMSTLLHIFCWTFLKKIILITTSNNCTNILQFDNYIGLEGIQNNLPYETQWSLQDPLPSLAAQF